MQFLRSCLLGVQVQVANTWVRRVCGLFIISIVYRLQSLFGWLPLVWCRGSLLGHERHPSSWRGAILCCRAASAGASSWCGSGSGLTVVGGRCYV